MNQTQVLIQEQAFDPGEVIRQMYRDRPDVGAVATFMGVCRDVNAGDRVQRMRLEHYPGMTETAIEKIVNEARSRWGILDCVVIHRIGVLEPTDPIVLVAISSAHRHQALEACSFVMDFLKTRAPFWKQEVTGSGEHWVASRDSDRDAAKRWK